MTTFEGPDALVKKFTEEEAAQGREWRNIERTTDFPQPRDRLIVNDTRD